MLKYINGQITIDNQNKALLKALKKYNLHNMSQWQEIPIADQCLNISQIDGKFFKLAIDTSQVKYMYVGRVNTCRSDGCSPDASLTMESETEYFDYFILFDIKKSIHIVRIFNYQATHGQEITAKSWLKQFEGYNNSGPLLRVNKTIDAISGATSSVLAITYDIQSKTEILHNINNKVNK